MSNHRRLSARGVVFSATVALLLCGAAAAESGGRATMMLDGEWQFRLDPDGAGNDAKWFSSDVPFKDVIQVPGAWQAQGYGAESDKLRHHYDGKAWYRRDIAVPAEWTGRRAFLCIGGVHRYAQVWVNGTPFAEHIGYLSPFEYEITRVAPAGKTATITVCVDSKQRWDVDCLTGCFDIIDEMFTPWGGIWGHVSMEARGAAWAEDLFVQTKATPPSCAVSAKLAGDRGGADAVLVEIVARDGRVAARSQSPLGRVLGPDGEVRIAVEIPGGQLWSPNRPYLYTARLSLLRDGNVVDRIEARFGVREIEIRGCDIYLNGRKIFLHGYGDDSVYPRTMAPPSDKDVYLKRLKVAKEYGFNYVRHHSTILPPEYYDAQDEMGILVSAEFPIAYLEYYKKAKGPALELYKTEWAAAIRRLRNHPSIFNWCLGNELWDSVPIAPDMYKVAKSLDPTRPVIDSDGVWAQPFVRGSADRDTLDFYQVQFDEPGALPLDDPGKYAHERSPKKPVLSHETGNYATFPRLAQIDGFKDNFKPFWLTPARDKMKKLGLLGEAEQWSKNSERLYLLAHKLNTEAIRKNRRMSGYTWWLIQDYWTGSNGIVDAYFRPKDIDARTVRQFNADVVLLQDGLALTYPAGRTLSLKLLASNYSEAAIRDGVLKWEARLGDRLLAGKDSISAQVGQGEIKELAEVRADLPDISEPRRLTIAAELRAGPEPYRNDWTAWIYPAKTDAPQLKVPLYAACDLIGPLAMLGAKRIPDGRAPGPAVYVVSQPNRNLLDAAEAGSCVVCLQPQGVFPAVRNRFKPAWWLGNDVDCNTGTVVYDNAVTQTIAPDGWCDAGWYRLLEGADAYVLDAFPAQPQVLVRGLDVHTRCRSKALLMQVRVGKGALIISGLNVGDGSESDTPEGRWLLARLVAYAGTLPRPTAELPIGFLREQVAKAPAPEGPMLPGFSGLIRNDGETAKERSYRQAEAPMYVCRQTEPGHAIEWETAAVPRDIDGKNITFVFAGSLGWKSQPPAGGFALLLNGKELLTFNHAQGYLAWRSADGSAVLLFVSRKGTQDDATGLFYLTVATDRVTPGESCRLMVQSKGSGSRRWFGLTPYTDVLAPDDGDKKR